MKNLFKYFVTATIAVAAILSCQREKNFNEDIPENSIKINVRASAQDFANDDADLKTYLGTYEGVANTVLWGTGEYMKLAVTAGENTTFANSTEDSADLFDGEPSALFEFSVSPAVADSYTYQGLYPASAAVGTNSNNNNPANYKVNLPPIQNATASRYDPAAYIMVAKPETFVEVQEDWSASFIRATALNKITLKNVPAGVSIKRVKITAPSGKYLAGARHINLTAEGREDVMGDIYNGGGRTETIEVKYATPLAGGSNIDVWFTSWDVLVEAGENLIIEAYSTDKKCYTKTITVPSDKTIKFQEGYLNTLGANMSNISPTDVTEIEEGDYVVLAKDGDSYYALKAEKESGKERLLSTEYTGSLDSYLGDADIIWSLTKSGDSFFFENDSKYLGYKDSSNESYWLEPDGSWTETNYLLDITPQETAGLYHVTLHSNSGRYLSKNSSSAFFAFYGNTGQKADIVFVPATIDNRTPVTLTFDEDDIALTTANYDDFPGQYVSASPNVSAITDHLSWDYEDNDGVIADFDDGVLELSGTAGTATVTVSFAGDATYRPASASYTIVVSTASGPQYLLVSTVAGVTEGDYIITWDNTYYLPSGTTSGSNPAVGTGITVANNKITNTVTAEMVWHFSGDNTEGFTISDGTNILHSTNTAQGISINTSSTRKWTVSLDGTYGMLLHGDDGGTRCLAVYNSGTWRYYSTGNSYTGVLRLYKLEDSRTDPGMSWSANSATATYGTGNNLTFTAPVLTSGNASSVTYSSSDETIATIGTTGEVSVNLNGNDIKVGSTTISAAFAGDANYKPQTVSYTLTVVDNRATVAAPTFSPAAGEVEVNTTVTISSSTSGATIYYTTDGSSPTTSSTSGSSVVIDAAKTIKALAVLNGYKNSSVATAEYTISGITENLPYIESFNSDKGSFTIDNVALDGLASVWSHATYNNSGYMKAGAYVNNINHATESWLKSPAIQLPSLTTGQSIKLSFDQCVSSFFGDVTNEATVWVKEDGGSWVKQTITYPVVSSGNFSPFEQQIIDLSTLAGKKIYIAFKYTSTSSAAGTWEVKNVSVKQYEPKALTSISISGQRTAFTVNDDFSFGGTVTAHYNDDTTADVTSSASFDGYNMSTQGTQTVTVSYSEGGVTKTATYSITVSSGGGNYQTSGTLASWVFSSSSYPSNKTDFAATSGVCSQSTFYLNGSGSTWNTSKGYAFTSVTDVTITIKAVKSFKAGSSLTLSMDTYYNKSSNAPMTGFSIKASESGGSSSTTGLDVSSWSLSNSSANKSVTYTIQNDVSAGNSVVFTLTGTGKVGSGQGFIGNIQAVYTAN